MKKSKQKVKEYARIFYHSKKEKYQQNSIMIKKQKTKNKTKTSFKNKCTIVTESFQRIKRQKIEKMEKIAREMCLKKKNKN